MQCIISGCKAFGAWGQEKDFFWTTSGPGFNSLPSALTVNPDHHSLVCLGYSAGYPLFTCQPLLQQLVCKTVLLKQWLYYLQFSFPKASLDGFIARTNMISLLRSRLFWVIDDVPDNSFLPLKPWHYWIIGFVLQEFMRKFGWRRLLGAVQNSPTL